MPAQVTGHLRKDATYGEKIVLDRLRTRLPPRYHVYVECPLKHGRLQHFPDFIIVTDAGVVVLEVKDWVQALECTKNDVLVLTRQNKRMRHPNPVIQARNGAIALAQELEELPPNLQRGRKRRRIPWGYAAVLPNLKAATGLSHLKQIWGENLVLSLNDLEHRDTTEVLRETLPNRIQGLSKKEIDWVRSVIYPVVRIPAPTPERSDIILDDAQEQIVTEAPLVQPAAEPQPEPQGRQETMFQPAVQVSKDDDVLPEEAARLVYSGAVRLVRGVAGSGKTLVLTQRVQYLAAQYPEWRICVLSYNKALAGSLQNSLATVPGVARVSTFDSLCTYLWTRSMGLDWKSPVNPLGWVRGHADKWQIIEQLGTDYVAEELLWRKEVGLWDESAYMSADRKGRGLALQPSQRKQLWQVMRTYQQYLDDSRLFDWTDVRARVWHSLEQGAIKPSQYDAVLVDEAQDMAPVWMRIVSGLVKPGGVLFLADDPSQSVYRLYSWREKGVHVVGRTRWLRVPYRNTQEIYRAAYETIRQDEVLRQQLGESDQLLEPDLAAESMTSGSKPKVRMFRSQADEDTWIRREVQAALASGLRPGQIAVLARRTAQVNRLRRLLHGTGIMPATFHGPKGLEFEAVFLTGMQSAFQGPAAASAEAISTERRLVYMAMTRARRRLYLSYQGRWPDQLEAVWPHLDTTPG